MGSAITKPTLFLSHSGSDTEWARQLKQRLASTPALQTGGLEIWFDKDSLVPGTPWQGQIEHAVGRSTAFAVVVGSGVANWVDAEVRLALDRAVTSKDYPFIPIFASSTFGPDALPGFARQYQGVRNVLEDAAEFDKLVAAILGHAPGGLRLEAHPFFGLRAIDESRNHLFFGREAETERLIRLVRELPLVLVHGDSGSGKSSLVRAGLVPRFRGGVIAQLDAGQNRAPEALVWHVVAMRPRRDPWRGLAEAVEEAAGRLGRPLADQGRLATWATTPADLEAVRRGLRCGLPPEHTRTLLVVDQFEELLTITPEPERKRFAEMLLRLADPHDLRVRIVLTMRQDYVNLCSEIDELRARLDRDERRARFFVGRMSDEGLERIVTEPLRLAGEPAAARKALARAVLRDVGERAGDLALVQMALTEAWERRADHGGDLVNAYVAAGRVEGALAMAADTVRQALTDPATRARLDAVLVRLVRLGDTGGATRRIASREEFGDDKWSLVARLAGEEGKRLVLLGGSEERPTAEIAHEALVTAWPHFQTLLQEAAHDKRILDELMPRARLWAEKKATKDAERHLATGADLEAFAGLRTRRAGWLSRDEEQLVSASRAAVDGRTRRERRQRQSVALFATMMTVAFFVALYFYDAASKARRATERQLEVTRREQSRVLAAVSREMLAEGDREGAARVALAALPADPTRPDRPVVPDAQRALAAAVAAGPLNAVGVQDGDISAIAALPDGRIVTGDQYKRVRLWHLDGPGRPTEIGSHDDGVLAVAVLPDGRIVTGGYDNRVRLWQVDQPGRPTELGSHDDCVDAIAVLPDGRIVTGGCDKRVRLWQIDQPGRPTELGSHDDTVFAIAVLPDGRIVTGGSDQRIRLWQIDEPGRPTELLSNDYVYAVAVLPDGRIVVATHERVLIVDPADMVELTRLIARARAELFSTSLTPDERRRAGLEQEPPAADPTAP